jgi:hypothetical protein
MATKVESDQAHSDARRQAQPCAPAASRFLLDLALFIDTMDEPAPGDAFTDSSGQVWTVTFPDLATADAIAKLIASAD